MEKKRESEKKGKSKRMFPKQGEKKKIAVVSSRIKPKRICLSTDEFAQIFATVSAAGAVDVSRFLREFDGEIVLCANNSKQIRYSGRTMVLV